MSIWNYLGMAYLFEKLFGRKHRCGTDGTSHTVNHHGAIDADPDLYDDLDLALMNHKADRDFIYDDDYYDDDVLYDDFDDFDDF